MTTYNTGNPIGSTDSRDRLDNTENMDYLENSTTELTHADRLGTVRKTRHGMEVEHDAQIAAHESEHDAQMQSFESDFDGRLAGMAFTRVGSFTAGATLTDMRQVLIWEVSQGGDGHEYGWAGTFPKVVAAGATPTTSGGIGAGAWVDRTDVVLHDEVRETTFQTMKRSYAEAGFNLVDGSFQMGGSLSGWPDVLWDWATGKGYQWHLDEAKTVAGGSSPTNIGTDWIDITNIVLRSQLASTDGAGLIGSMGYEQLRAYSGSQTTVNVWGISNVFDGAAGQFKVNASDTTSADNGGTILVDASGRRWYRILSGSYDPIWFGADNTGATDATSAVQAAITAAGAGGTISFKKGTYLLSSTINCLSNQTIKGERANSTTLYRTGNYGDTFYFASAGAAHVSDLWFNHSSWYNPSSGSLPNKATSGAHIHLKAGQYAVVENCYMWRGYISVLLDSCTITTIRKNWMMGVWDDENTAFQEGMANIYLSDTNGPNEIIAIVENYISGAKSASRNITYTPIDGVHSTTGTDNIGSRFGIYVESCEDLLIANNFIGANDVAGVQSQCSGRHVSLDWRIIGNFFDDGPTLYGGANIYFSSSASGYYVNGVIINGNVFNGELKGINAITAFNPANTSDPAVANFSIMGNTFQAFVGTPMQLLGARNGVISGNNITGVNSLGYGVTDPNYAAAIYLGGMTSYVQVHGNNHGGLTNSGAVGGGNKLGIVNTGTNFGANVVRDNMAIGVGGSATGVGMEEDGVVILTANGGYQATTADRYVIFSKADTTAWPFGLPLNPRPGRKITIKDGNGRAGTYAVQVVGNVDGTVNPMYNTAYFSKTFIYNGVLWNAI